MRTKLHATISPGVNSWVGVNKGGLRFTYVIWEHEAAVELYIDRGKESGDENKKVFDALTVHRQEVEAAFGGPLEWERLDGKRACRIRKTIATGGIRDEEATWVRTQDDMIENMVRLEKALAPQIADLAGG